MENSGLSQKKIKMISMFATTFIVYNVVLFALCGFAGHDFGFWISYVFMLIAFVDVAVVVFFLKGHKVLPKDWLLGYPILKHATIYIIAEFMISVLFMIGDGYGWNGSVAFAIQTILMAVHLIFIISCFYAKQTIEEVQHSVQVNTTNMRLLLVDVEMIVEKALDTDVKRNFQNLAEKVRYSDPISNEYLSDIENAIRASVTEAAVYVGMDDKEEALAACKKASLLLEERNKKCKVFKQVR